MRQILTLFPPYLLVLIVIFIFIPTTVAFFLRLSLYKHLIARQKQIKSLISYPSSPKPSLIQTLEKRFRQASQELDEVNTGALIDECYNDETFSLLNWQLPCEQWDYFPRILPNLLLAFGLLGTFVGITYNLYGLSQTIGQVDLTDINNLVTRLQTPLESMGIAFLSSLVALIASSFLTIVNLRCNTTVAKYLLISTIEDYLDNIYRPREQGDTRLDKAVNRMVQQQEEFLTRFHEKVGQVMEDSLGKAANQLVAANRESQQLARQVYEKLTQVSGTLATGASTFQAAVFQLEKQVITISEQVPPTRESAQLFNQSSLIFQKAANQIEASKFSNNLELLTADLAKTQAAFSQTTTDLKDTLAEIIDANRSATILAGQVYNEFKVSSGQLQESGLAFLEAAEIVKNTDFAEKLATITTELSNTYQQFQEAAHILNDSTETIATGLNNLDDSAKQLVEFGQKIAKVNEQSGEMIYLTQRRLANEEEGLQSITQNLEDLAVKIRAAQESQQNNFNSFQKEISHNLGQLWQEVQYLQDQERQSAESRLQQIEAQLIKILQEQKVILKDFADFLVKYINKSQSNQEYFWQQFQNHQNQDSKDLEIKLKNILQEQKSIFKNLENSLNKVFKESQSQQRNI